jgi:hypothetical protein
MAARRDAPGRKPRPFACAGCGAVQRFRPGTRELACGFCGHVTAIPAARGATLREHPLREGLAALGAAGAADAPPSMDGGHLERCPACAAQFSLDPLADAGECPFCATPVVAGTAGAGTARPRPHALVPFRLDDRAAADAFRAWLSRLRFRPARLARFARLEGALRGIYLPYWTYDAKTTTTYRGERGTVYYVRVPVTVTRNGRRVTTMQRQARVRWSPVAGTVSRHFDDVLVDASASLPRAVARRLGPWRLEELTPWDERFLAGFRSEVYQVPLDEGFRRACDLMETAIRGDVARDIGGDHQRIRQLETRHLDVTFKHVLLPVWVAAFRYRGRVFQIAVNGQTGAVAGQRPWSWMKICLTILIGSAAVTGIVWWLHRRGVAFG